MACWSCAGELEGEQLFCPACGSLQPPPSGYFAIFGIEPRLDVDTAALQKQFYNLSRRLHPDRFGRKSERERNYSVDASALLNDAWRVLRDPVRRAEYVLEQSGLNISEQRGKDVPPELLEEVFELNMALEELRGGDPDARPQLESARNRFLELENEIDSSLEDLFRRNDAAAPEDRPPVLAELRALLNRRRYIENLIRDVEKELDVHVSN